MTPDTLPYTAMGTCDAELGELLIDCEEDRVLRAVLVGVLPEVEGR